MSKEIDGVIEKVEKLTNLVNEKIKQWYKTDFTLPFNIKYDTYKYPLNDGYYTFDECIGRAFKQKKELDKIVDSLIIRTGYSFEKSDNRMKGQIKAKNSFLGKIGYLKDFIEGKTDIESLAIFIDLCIRTRYFYEAIDDNKKEQLKKDITKMINHLYDFSKGYIEFIHQDDTEVLDDKAMKDIVKLEMPIPTYATDFQKKHILNIMTFQGILEGINPIEKQSLQVYTIFYDEDW